MTVINPALHKSLADADDVIEALAKIGADPDARARLLTALRELEGGFIARGINAREDISGPIVDALHRDVGELEKTLSGGLKLTFTYRSKISRDFVMAASDSPDHCWEPQTTKLLLQLSEDKAHVVIGGAYFGDHALLLGRSLAGSGGRCHCFEVNTEQFALLTANLRSNGLDNVVANRLALWHEDDKAARLVGLDAHGATAIADELGAGDFSTISLNTYGSRNDVDQFGVIMLDIEGAELPALRGADRYLKQSAGEAPDLIFELARYYVDWSGGLENTDIVKYLEDTGYNVFAVRDYQSNVATGNSPVEIIPVREIYLANQPHGFNMLAIKELDTIARHGLSICSGVSPKLLFHEDPALHQPLQ